jgi:hypothetical protein
MAKRITGDENTQSLAINIPTRVDTDSDMLAFRIGTMVMRKPHLTKQVGGFCESDAPLLQRRLSFIACVLAHRRSPRCLRLLWLS